MIAPLCFTVEGSVDAEGWFLIGGALSTALDWIWGRFGLGGMRGFGARGPPVEGGGGPNLGGGPPGGGGLGGRPIGGGGNPCPKRGGGPGGAGGGI